MATKKAPAAPGTGANKPAKTPTGEGGIREISLDDPGSSGGIEISPEVGDFRGPLHGGVIRSPIVEPAAPAPPPPNWSGRKHRAPAEPPPIPKRHAGHPQQQVRRQTPAERIAYQIPPARHFASDPYASKRGFGLLLLLGLALIALAAVIVVKKPEWISIVRVKVIELKDIAIEKWHETTDGNMRIVRVKDEPTDEGDETARATTGGFDTSCRSIMAMGLNKVNSTDLTVGERVAIADCFLLMSDPVAANIILTPVAANLSKFSDKQLRAGRSSAAVDAFFGILVTNMRLGQPQKTDLVLKERCTTWEMTPACVGKLWVYTERDLYSSAAEGFRRMQATVGRLDNSSEAYFWLSGAKLAATQGQAEVAIQRFEDALKMLPTGSDRLRKDIYESYSIALYHAERTQNLRSVTTAGLQQLRAVSRPAMTKLAIMNDLTNEQKRKATITKFLSRPEIYQRVAGDVHFLDVVGVEALRAGQAEQFLNLVKSTDDTLKVAYKSTSNWSKRVMAWEVRALLAQEKWEFALNALNYYASRFQEDALSYHLRGVIYMNVSSHERYQVLAAQQFQESLKQQLTWEGLCALGISLSRAQKLDQVPQIIKQLENMTNNPNANHWTRILRAEFFVGKEDWDKAEQVLQKVLKTDPDSYTAHALLLKTLERRGKVDETNGLRLQFDELQARIAEPDTSEGFGSPIGALALSRRPGM